MRAEAGFNQAKLLEELVPRADNEP